MTEARSNPLRSPRILIALAAAIAVLAGGLWFFLLRDDAPDAFDLDDAAESVDGSGSDFDGDLEGTWTVASSGASPSEAGFRVSEELSGIGANVAVGRTTGVTGSLVIGDSAVTAVEITVDLASLATDDSRRDGRMRSALDTATFPTATFVLTEPIPLASVPEAGQAVEFRATGDLTVKGVTQPVTVTLDAQLVDGILVVVGSADIVFADFGVEAPTAPIVLSVADQGTIEFQLYFVQA